MLFFRTQTYIGVVLQWDYLFVFFPAWLNSQVLRWKERPKRRPALTQKTFNLLVFPSIKASSFTANQLRRVAPERFDLILMSTQTIDMIGCFRFVMCCVSGNCYANMNVEQFQRHILQTIDMIGCFRFVMYCVSGNCYGNVNVKQLSLKTCRRNGAKMNLVGVNESKCY